MLQSINKVIKTLIFYDLIFLFGWGLVAPILAVFIIGNIKGGNVQVAGIAVGIYWVLKSLLQIPIGQYLDINHGEKDDYYFLIAGTFLAGLVPFGFIFATLPWHIYLLQAVHALAAAALTPSWGGIFTRHMDRGKEAQIWALDSSAFGIGVGIAGIIGGTVAKTLGFTPLFIGVGLCGVVSALLCFFIRDELLPKGKVMLIPKPE